MASAIVTSTYRYKRPPRKKRPVLLEVPAIVTKCAASPQASAPKPAAPANDDRKPAIVAIPGKPAKADGPLTVRGGSGHAPSGIDTRRFQPAAVTPRSAIVTVKRRSSRFGDVPDLTPEKHQRRGDAADALFREITRQIAAKDRP